MHFDWAYTFGLLKNKDFWQATLTVIERAFRKLCHDKLKFHYSI